MYFDVKTLLLLYFFWDKYNWLYPTCWSESHYVRSMPSMHSSECLVANKLKHILPYVFVQFLPHFKSNFSPTDDVTVAICPGIGNTSESVYIRTYVHYSQCHGYRCAVLNHIGALNSVPVTGNRIFSYGKIVLIMRMAYVQELQWVLSPTHPTYVCLWQTLKLLSRFWCCFHLLIEMFSVKLLKIWVLQGELGWNSPTI